MERGLGPGSEKHHGACGHAVLSGRVWCGRPAGHREVGHTLQGGWTRAELRSQKWLYRGQMELSPELPKAALCGIPQWSRGARRPDGALTFAPLRVSTAANVRCHTGPHTGACHAAAIRPASEGQFLKWIFLPTTWQSLDIKYRDVCWKLFIPSWFDAQPSRDGFNSHWSSSITNSVLCFRDRTGAALRREGTRRKMEGAGGVARLWPQEHAKGSVRAIRQRSQKTMNKSTLEAQRVMSAYAATCRDCSLRSGRLDTDVTARYIEPGLRGICTIFR